MNRTTFPALDPSDIETTRRALHAYSRVLGDWLKASRARRKHWWHASLRPSIDGLTTGVIYAEKNVEIALDFRRSRLTVATTGGARLSEALTGQPEATLGEQLNSLLRAAEIADDQILRDGKDRPTRDSDAITRSFPDYSPEVAVKLADALSGVAAALTDFRAGIREETSPIQLWPHHFDLSMLWLPGDKIPDRDPADEEYADKQMNFGFVFGDDGITEPYFYVTAYPLPEALPDTALPAGTVWKSDGFNGAVLLYKELIKTDDATEYLHSLWSTLLKAGRKHLSIA